MLDKRLLCTALAVVVVTMTAVVVTTLPVNEEIVPSQENVSDIEQEEMPEADGAEEFPYLLKEYGGRIGVYLAGANEPEMILDVPVKHLPDQDQKQLAEGIAVPDYDRLVSLIEDYSS